MCMVVRSRTGLVKLMIFNGSLLSLDRAIICEQHASCGKCALFTNDAQDDAQAMREAGIKAKESAQEQGVSVRSTFLSIPSHNDWRYDLSQYDVELCDVEQYDVELL